MDGWVWITIRREYTIDAKLSVVGFVTKVASIRIIPSLCWLVDLPKTLVNHVPDEAALHSRMAWAPKKLPVLVEIPI
jgi:hypothetical protein